ncbi:cytochrome P450 [Ideonella sp. BN130291]|uniref:cytochrome P450 n=1 Tax=Ideonella sp. BN130291 TaxID=3112940 RepID=UPI002E2643AE|nr:cytochrome P450 [Ideonella sp. BN130291]
MTAAPHALPPGPPTPWWGLPLLREMRRDYIGFVTALQQRYGDVSFMRLGPEPAYDVFDPALVRQALVDQADHLIRWERGIQIFEQAFGQSVLVTEGSTWQRQRRMLMPGFTPRRVQGYATLMTAAARNTLDAAVPPGQPHAEVDIGALMSQLTMDVILRTLFSAPDQGESRDAARATQVLGRGAIREMFWPMTLPDWLPLPGKRAKRWGLRTLRGLVRGHIARRQALPAGQAPQGDLLAMLLAATDDQTGQGLSATEVHDQCMVMFQAGHETSATALLWWAWLMACHPAAQQAAHKEVLAALGGREPTAADAPALDWLGASLKEAMRLYPPVGALMSRRVIKPLRLGQWHVPAGALLRITPWVIQRDPRWFAEPGAFRPERFLSSAEAPPRGSWLPFGTGPRVCIGQHFAMLEMTLVAAMLLQRYEIQLVAGEPVPQPEMSVTVRPAAPLRLLLLRRPMPRPQGDEAEAGSATAGAHAGSSTSMRSVSMSAGRSA